MKGHFLGVVVLSAIWGGCSLVDPQADHEVISPIITIDTTATGKDDSIIPPPGDDEVVMPDEGNNAEKNDYFPLAIGNYWVYDYLSSGGGSSHVGTYRFEVVSRIDQFRETRYIIEGRFEGYTYCWYFCPPDTTAINWTRTYPVDEVDGKITFPWFLRSSPLQPLEMERYQAAGDTLRFGASPEHFGVGASFVQGIGPVRISHHEKGGVLSYTYESLELRDYHIEGQ